MAAEPRFNAPANVRWWQILLEWLWKCPQCFISRPSMRKQGRCLGSLALQIAVHPKQRRNNLLVGRPLNVDRMEEGSRDFAPATKISAGR
jgi:hypothetical protein